MKSFVVAILALGLILFAQSNTVAQKNSKEQQYFMDVHKMEANGFTYADVAGAHQKDLDTQKKRNVSFITYWVDEDAGLVYCLSKADKASDVSDTHKEAHGLVPAEIYPVVAGKASTYTGNGKLFMDIHELGPGNVTADAVAGAHEKDLATEGQYHVNFINYWVDEKSGKVFCLAEAPNAEAVVSTHKNAHGLIPAVVLEVTQGQ
ncbi:MAG TPA: DUF4242 domain-containing protein [Saprospiraceae bacterium]|nr:DUF4242 domain-containing protein [Saprospiraceae bacterium]